VNAWLSLRPAVCASLPFWFARLACYSIVWKCSEVVVTASTAIIVGHWLGCQASTCENRILGLILTNNTLITVTDRLLAWQTSNWSHIKPLLAHTAAVLRSEHVNCRIAHACLLYQLKEWIATLFTLGLRVAACATGHVFGTQHAHSAPSKIARHTLWTSLKTALVLNTALHQWTLVTLKIVQVKAFFALCTLGRCASFTVRPLRRARQALPSEQIRLRFALQTWGWPVTLTAMFSQHSTAIDTAFILCVLVTKALLWFLYQ
jgi:hypothetical protein